MGKSGRRVQANARTLSYAVRQYFRPALREIQPAASTSNYAAIAGSSSSNSLLMDAGDDATPTPDDQLIPTQPEEPASARPVVSEKSLGKRKRNDEEQHATQQHGIQTRFTQTDIPPALKKCEPACSGRRCRCFRVQRSQIEYAMETM